MRRRIIIVTLSLLAVFAIGCALLILGRDNGKPPIVHGTLKLSDKDISQIQQAVRSQLWHETFPNLSVQTFKTLPVHLRAALTDHVTYIVTDSRTASAFVLCGTNRDGTYPTYVLTNGPTGWQEIQGPSFFKEGVER